MRDGIAVGCRRQPWIWHPQMLTPSAHAAKRGSQRAELADAAWQLTHDPLTGLHNRAGLQAIQAATASSAEPQPIVTMLIDLDLFKKVNDAHSHDAGDDLLKATADRIGHLAALYGGHASRLTGDEFAAIMPLGRTRLTSMAEQSPPPSPSPSRSAPTTGRSPSRSPRVSASPSPPVSTCWKALPRTTPTWLCTAPSGKAGTDTSSTRAKPDRWPSQFIKHCVRAGVSGATARSLGVRSSRESLAQSAGSAAEHGGEHRTDCRGDAHGEGEIDVRHALDHSQRQRA